MRLRNTLLTLAALALAACAAASAQEQQQKKKDQTEPRNDQQVIDDFVITRGMSFTGPSKPAPKPARPAPTPRRSSTARNKRPTAVSPSGDAASGKPAAGKGGAALKTDGGGAQPVDGGAGGAKFVPAGSRPLSLGYTVLLKDDANQLWVVDPSREFKTGENVVVALEPDADGYIYMFVASAGKNPEMTFPHVLLDGGANAVEGHARSTFPADPAYDFGFEDPPAAEHLFIVFSRDPLAGVPTGEALLEFCKGKGDGCVWKPTPAQWEKIRGGGGFREVKNSQLAQGDAPLFTPEMLTRDMKVKKRDPGPAFVRTSATPGARLLVTEIVFTHK